METNKLIELYKKEREYQKECFSDYSKITSLNLASFLNFIRTYLEKAEKAYSGVWDQVLPSWLTDCKERIYDGTAPVKVYEELIKVMALAGAALETYSEIDPEEWRNSPEEGKKWKR
jgi:hypothetical protein